MKFCEICFNFAEFQQAEIDPNSNAKTNFRKLLNFKVKYSYCSSLKRLNYLQNLSRMSHSQLTKKSIICTTCMNRVQSFGFFKFMHQEGSKNFGKKFNQSGHSQDDGCTDNSIDDTLTPRMKRKQPATLEIDSDNAEEFNSQAPPAKLPMKETFTVGEKIKYYNTQRRRFFDGIVKEMQKDHFYVSFQDGTVRRILRNTITKA